MLTTYSPLESVLGDSTSGLHVILDDLFHQIEAASKLPPNESSLFKFHIDEQDAKVAREELKIVAETERHLYAMAQHLNAMFYGDADLTHIQVSRGECVKEHKLPTKTRYVIGKDIPLAIYSEQLESPDILIAQKYPPFCDICKTTKNHMTTSSYSRHLPSEFLASYDAVDATDRDIIIAKDKLFDMETQQTKLQQDGFGYAAKMAGHARELRKKIVNLEHSRTLAEQALEHRLMQSDYPVLFVQTRVKGNARIRDKILRLAVRRHLDEVEHVKQLPPVLDLYGARVVCRDIDGEYGASAIANRIKAEAIQLFGPDSFQKEHHEVKIVNDRKVFDAYKVWLRWGSDKATPLVNVHVEQFHDYVHDKKDHPEYELRQLNILEKGKEHLPVDALREELGKLFPDEE